ncbi:hypothetical protein BN1013_00182 [Candidatus Rubidus massiliensis]|nr:MAG: hypothetical protein BGO10_07845 [Chlamydia sp. 32-24]CDZ79686.1 hypothetical protein BN1013_00182 [Candidatus Rubidus massiliensis]
MTIQKGGNHTYPIIIDYILCPTCNFINENRSSYNYVLGNLQKNVKCEKCGTTFLYKKKRRIEFGPLLNEPSPPEVNWED